MRAVTMFLVYAVLSVSMSIAALSGHALRFTPFNFKTSISFFILFLAMDIIEFIVKLQRKEEV